jgi:two-component system nitrogen regulation response regulator GlnG
MRLNPATAVTLPTLRERRDDFRVLLLSFMRRVVREPYNRDLLRQYAEQRGLAIDPDLAALPVSVGTTVPAHFDPHRIHFLFHPSSYKLMQESTWPGNFRQFEMVLSNLTTLTLVELVDRAEQVEPEDPHKAGRPDVIPLLPRTVRELLGARPEPTSSPGSSSEGRRPSSAPRLEVEIQPRESLNAVSCEVERQYLEQLYQTSGGDLSRVAEVLLGNSRAARKVQLRMNQLGIKLRRLRQRTRA